MVNNIESAIKINREIYNNFPKLKEVHMASSFAISDSFEQTNTQYYNDPKKKRRGKIYAAATTGIMAITAIALALKAKGAKSIKVKDIIEKSKKGAEYIKETGIGDKIVNISDNCVNIKDDLWDKFLGKIENTPLKPLRRVGDWITGIYKNAIKSTFSNKYSDICAELKTAGYKGELAEFDNWFNKTNESMLENFHKKGDRVSDGLLNKKIVNKLTDCNIADNKISNLLEKEIIKIPKDASPELEKAIHKYNDLKGVLLPKLRDVNCGCAPTDLLTIIASTLGLGIAIGVTDDKEKRKSTALNLGIPLLTTLACTTYGTIKCLSGAKSLMFGLVTGQIAGIGAKIIDKVTSKKPVQAEEK